MARQCVSGSGAGQHPSLGATRAAWSGASAGVQATARARGYTASASLGVQRRRQRGQSVRVIQTHPQWVQFDVGLTCSAPLPMEACLQSKRRWALAHLRDRPRQLVRQERQGLPLARLFLAAGQRDVPGGLGAQAPRRRFGKGPLEGDMADWFAGRAHAFAR
jgi:hypothetical protein